MVHGHISRDRKRELIDLPGVVAVGEGHEDGEPRVVITIEPGSPTAEEGLPNEVDGIPVRVEVGERFSFDAEDDLPPPMDLQVTDRVRPVQAGTSTSNAMTTGTGTLGPVMEDENGNIYLTSNWHVWDSGDAQVDDPVIQPGGVDGGDESDQIAFFDDSNGETLDAAYATPTDDVGVATEVYNVGEVQGSREPELGMPVVKSGRTTGVTEGEVTQVDVTIGVADSDRVLEGQFVAELESDAGDSGSPYLHADTHEVIGLHWGGSSGTTAANDITDVEAWSGLTVATGVSPDPPNEPPVAEISGSTDLRTVDVGGFGSHDPDGQIVSWEWDFHYHRHDSFVAEKTGTTSGHTYNYFGERQIALRVTDDQGATDIDDVWVTLTDPCEPVECGPGEVCDGGECVPDPSNPCADMQCPAGDVCEGGECVPSPDCMYQGHPREAWGYTGGNTDLFEQWRACEISTKDFQSQTPGGQGTAALVPPGAQEPGINPRLVVALLVLGGVVIAQ